MKFNFSLILLLLFVGCNQFQTKEVQSLIESQRDQLTPYFEKYGKPEDFTWRYIHPEEKFLSLDDYIKQGPAGITKERDKIYMLPLGPFSKGQSKIIEETANYCRAFFGLEIVLLPNKPMPEVPSNMKRLREERWQYNTTYFLNTYLSIQPYKDAAVLIAFTSYDLYPKDDWNYVFGIASLKSRVGIWSIHRFGNPDQDSASFRACLDRTRKVASHEIGHMFSIPHCVQYQCVMNGSNSMPETDIHPGYLCPECVAKLSWDLKQTPKEHLVRMRTYWTTHDDNGLVELYGKLIKAIE